MKVTKEICACHLDAFYLSVLKTKSLETLKMEEYISMDWVNITNKSEESHEKEVATMRLTADCFIFKQELTLLYKDYARCHDGAIKKEIAKDIELLQKAMALIL